MLSVLKLSLRSVDSTVWSFRRLQFVVLLNFIASYWQVFLLFCSRHLYRRGWPEYCSVPTVRTVDEQRLVKSQWLSYLANANLCSGFRTSLSSWESPTTYYFPLNGSMALLEGRCLAFGHLSQGHLYCGLLEKGGHFSFRSCIFLTAWRSKVATLCSQATADPNLHTHQ